MRPLKIISSIAEFQKWRKDQVDQTLGFVPTMGALHDGHSELLRKSIEENDVTVLSIFINPTQFNNSTDLEKYPKTWTQDLERAQKLGVTCVLHPDYNEMYPDQYRYRISENDFSKVLCGAHRPGHFDGVLTVVLKLLNIVQPRFAYFGEKDYQQFLIIKDLAASFFLPTQIIPCPTVRDEDGLALSSRNSRLSNQELQRAKKINQILRKNMSPEQTRTEFESIDFKVEYLADYHGRRFVAGYMGDVRLIDNVKI